MSTAKNILALLVGLGACALVLGGSELVLRAVEGREDQATTMFSSAKYFADTDDRGLGYRFAPLSTAAVQKYAGEELVYSTTYSADWFGRRITPLDRNGAARGFALFFGDSNVFGEGLHSDETIPYYFGLRTAALTPYNYGFHGYGPQHMYVKLRDPSFAAEVPEPGGIAIYAYFDHHINRVIGSTEVMRWNPGNLPYFALENGRLLHRGTFATGRSRLTAWYVWLSRLQMLRALHIELPIITSAHRKLQCEILAQSKQEFEKKFPGSTFVVVLMPPSDSRDDIQRTCFEPRKMPFIDFRSLWGPGYENKLHFIPHDGHYGREATAHIADALHKELVRLRLIDG